MKKLTAKRKARLARKSAWAEWKRRRREGFGRIYGMEVRYLQQRTVSRRQLTQPPSAVVKLTGRLDLLHSPTATIAQLNALSNVPRSRSGQRVHVLLDDVTYVDAPSLLFLCSRIRHLRARYGTVVTGSYPKDWAAQKTLMDADFPGFLQGRKPKFDKTTRTLQLHEGTSRKRIVTSIAADVQQFLAEVVPELTKPERIFERDLIYVAASESLENIRVHAYSPFGYRGGLWYTVGLYDPVRQCAVIAILDMGVGMKVTVQKKLGPAYRLLEWLTVPTFELIREATLGIRTASGERHRGKGLSSLREFSVAQPDRRFHVLSGDGMVTWMKGKQDAACSMQGVPEFEGTIVCLEIGVGTPA